MNFRNGLFLINLIHCVLISIYKNLIDPAISSLLSDNVVFYSQYTLSYSLKLLNSRMTPLADFNESPCFNYFLKIIIC